MKFNVNQNINTTEHTLYEGEDEEYARQLIAYLINEYSDELLLKYPELEKRKAISIAKQRFNINIIDKNI